jgi:hypothetical protein
MSSITLPVTAGDVREHFRSNAKAMAALPEAAQHTLREGARGRLHPEVIAAFNKGKSPSKRYNEGTPRTVALTYKRVTKSGSRAKQVALPESQIRALAAEAGFPVGARGPLSEAALVAAGEQYASTLA